jgi:hypothetical protein
LLGSADRRVLAQKYILLTFVNSLRSAKIDLVILGDDNAVVALSHPLSFDYGCDVRSGKDSVMKRDLVEVLEVDRIAAAEFIKDMLDANFDRARARTPLEEEVVAEAESLASYLIDADTRTSCILAVSFLEDTLKKNFVEKWNIKGRKSYDLYFGSNGPVSSLSQRSLVAQALQWIPEDLAREIDLLRKIRNEFAHNHRVHRLTSEPLQSFAVRLEAREQAWNKKDAILYHAAYGDASKETQLRMRIYCCVLYLVGQLLARSKLISHHVPPGYREQGFFGLTEIEQNLIDTMVRFCLRSLKIDRTGL